VKFPLIINIVDIVVEVEKLSYCWQTSNRLALSQLLLSTYVRVVVSFVSKPLKL